MAQIYVGTEATQIIPGAIASIKVQSGSAGLSTLGVVVLVGEADAGPDFSLEKDLNDNAYGPNQVGAVMAKYKSGPLVDAFKAAASPLNDPDIPGAPSRIIPIKTNPSVKATGSLKKFDGSTYATIQDRTYGKDGNLISPVVEAAQNEIVPTTGTFTWTPPVADFDMAVVLNGVFLDDGGADRKITVTATTTAAAFAAQLTALGLVTTVNGNDITVSAPTSDPISGTGKSLELVELTSAAGLLSTSCAPNTWVSKAAAPKVLTSAAEYKVKVTASRKKDGLSDEFVAGGDVALKIGYTGNAATVTINDLNLTTTVTGGTGANLDLSLKDFPTIADLAAYINAQTGYTAAVGSAVIGQLPSTALDDGTFGCVTSQGVQTGRIKVDGYKLYNKIVNEGILVTLSEQPASGLPAPQAAFYLLGGARGGTTATQFVAAIDACEKVRCNFIVPLFSRDASKDITDGKTDSSSTYTIDAIHAYCRTHVQNMSKVKQRKNRQAFLSIQDTFEICKEKAANISSFRCSMSFLDQKVLGSDGTVQQLPPYIDAAIAAGGQAAGVYKSITWKFKNVSGSLQKAGDWNDEDNTNVEDALLAGLLPTRRHDSGAYYFVSDQTTYSRDSNFVFNSIQAVYVSDIIALESAQRMEDAFAGQSQADVSAPVALAFLEAIYEDFLRRKLIATSDDAPQGFKNPSVNVRGPAMIVGVEAKVAGTVYFIPINILVSMVQQSA